MDKVILAVGRRKTSTARVILTPGTGKFRINGRDVNEYFNVKSLLPEVFKPLEITNLKDKFDIRANVEGGGFRGQADAIKLGIARALLKVDESLKPVLKSVHLLSRDPREKERKKYGLHSARKDRQYRKR
ncbi:30S ribosomal protein S9 [Caldisericum exile]|uniref:Small ribosomal subunit protein uS9 n=1 Tax=Caldisericum exile (strain DSM 21853 / NBRC 104410 / AZM16c01) TaxID=511051 RepID=A0A7U6GF33_CALEA|nr:30S ribosomal protein S9 [Caldisericum exile]BAL81233.1 30S ribosomal protein S9 [Caldisericum exile AZM16c01]